MRVLVDTCVIIDALQSRAPFSEAAQKLFIYSANKQFEGYITAKSVTDIYYLTHRLTHNDVETRIRSEMDCIVTRNVKDYMKSSVKVCEPSALLKLLEEENETE